MFRLIHEDDQPMRLNILSNFALISLLSAAVASAATWQPAAGPLTTRWSRQVSPQNALPEYPRPQMVRKDWMNLNGLWDFGITPLGSSQPASFETNILVPFP